MKKKQGESVDLAYDGMESASAIEAICVSGEVKLIGKDLHSETWRLITDKEIEEELVWGYMKLDPHQKYDVMLRYLQQLPNNRVHHIALDRSHGQRGLDSYKGAARSEAVQTLCQLDRAFADPTAASLIFLASLQAPLQDLLVPSYGSVTIAFPDLIQAPYPMQHLLSLFGGDEHWESKRWQCTIPHLLRPVVRLGDLHISADSTAYLGVGFWRKERCIALPISSSNRVIALEPGLPPNVRNPVLRNPLTVTILLGDHRTKERMPVLTADGQGLLTFDPDVLAALNAQADPISALILSFAAAMRKHPKRFLQSVSAAYNGIVPRHQSGKFIKTTADATQCAKSAMLAVLYAFLNWCVVNGYMPNEQANQFLQSIWARILPESAPNQARTAEKGQAAGTLRMDDARCFGLFLSEYIAEHCDHMKQPEEPWTPGTVGLIRRLEGQPEPLVIFDRRQLFDIYFSYIKQAGGDASYASTVKESEFPAKLQRVLIDAGVPIRDGGRDVTWRYGMYPKSVETHKTPALGLPTGRLISFWHTLQIPVDKTVELLLTLERDMNKPDSINVPESSENAGESA